MTKDAFIAHAERLWDTAHGEMWRKNADYATSGDVLANHRQAAADLNLSPRMIAWVYFHKHLAALRRWVNGEPLESESLESRFVDLLNFVLILWAIAHDDGSL